MADDRTPTPKRQGFLRRLFGDLLRDLVRDLFYVLIGTAVGAVAGGIAAAVYGFPLWGVVGAGAVIGFFATIFVVNYARD